MPPMTNAVATFWWKWRWRPAFEGAAVGAAIAIFLFAIDLTPESTARVRQVCSEAVNTVLTTKDLLEFERAKFLVEQLPGCRIRP